MRLEVTLVFAALVFVALLPFIIADVISGSILWPFWKIVGGVCGSVIILFASFEYSVSKN